MEGILQYVCVCACVCPLARIRACMRACVRACMNTACLCLCVYVCFTDRQQSGEGLSVKRVAIKYRPRHTNRAHVHVCFSQIGDRGGRARPRQRRPGSRARPHHKGRWHTNRPSHQQQRVQRLRQAQAAQAQGGMHRRGWVHQQGRVQRHQRAEVLWAQTLPIPHAQTPLAPRAQAGRAPAPAPIGLAGPRLVVAARPSAAV